MSLQLAKSDAMQKQIDMFEQLEQTKQQLRQAQNQIQDLKRRDTSPNSAPLASSQSHSQVRSTQFYIKNEDQQIPAPQSVSKPPVLERPRFEGYPQ